MAKDTLSFWGCEIQSFKIWLKLFFLQILVNLIAVVFTVALLYACGVVEETIGQFLATAVFIVYTFSVSIQFCLLILNTILKKCGRRGIFHIAENNGSFKISINDCPFDEAA